jgi:ElaB/YqjD/DUF883 family membrane-anchored ribosome-binding protein
MNAEEMTQSEVESEELNFDAHEFDGLRDEFAGMAEGWLQKADVFIQQNPWLCIAIATGVGCALGAAIRAACDSESDPVETT